MTSVGLSPASTASGFSHLAIAGGATSDLSRSRRSLNLHEARADPPRHPVACFAPLDVPRTPTSELTVGAIADAAYPTVPSDRGLDFALDVMVSMEPDWIPVATGRASWGRLPRPT